jgi:hypothetical protein
VSILSKIWKGVRSVAAPLIGGAIGGPVGAAIGTALGGSARVPSAVTPIPQTSVPAAPNVNWGALQPAAAVLPRIGPALLGGATGMAGLARGAGYAAGRIYAAASSYCRRNPQWCATVGGMAAVEAMVRSGQLPAPKRRRGRGITATELRNFKRVAKFTSKYCAPVRRAMSAPALRGKRG